ncbi:hypothetical protein D3C76_882320 [compost metagenome]
MDALGQQLLAGTGLAAQQHRGVQLRGAAGLALDLAGGGAGADEAGDGVAGAARPGQFALGCGELGLQLVVLGHDRLQVARAVEQYEAQGAHQGAVFVAQGNAGDHEVLVAEGHQVEHARLAVLHDFAQAAGRQYVLDLLAEHAARIGDADLLGVLVVDPDDPRLAIHRDGAFALGVEMVEQQRHGHFTEALGGDADDQAVLVEVFAGDGHGGHPAETSGSDYGGVPQ